MILMDDVNKFIGELPKMIEWIKDLNDIELEQDGTGKEYYTSFFNIWKGLDYTPDLTSLAKKAETIVYDTLVDGPIHKHYENPLSYELSDDAKRYYWVAGDIYTYVIWLQEPNRFPDKTRLYFDKIYKKWIKKPYI